MFIHARSLYILPASPLRSPVASSHSQTYMRNTRGAPNAAVHIFPYLFACTYVSTHIHFTSYHPFLPVLPAPRPSYTSTHSPKATPRSPTRGTPDAAQHIFLPRFLTRIGRGEMTHWGRHATFSEITRKLGVFFFLSFFLREEKGTE